MDTSVQNMAKVPSKTTKQADFDNSRFLQATFPANFRLILHKHVYS